MKVKIDFPCEKDVFYLRPELTENEIPENYDVQYGHERFVFIGVANYKDTTKVSLVDRFFKLSPPGYCPITHYLIKKVSTDSSFLSNFFKYFKLTLDGEFSVEPTDFAYTGYKVYV